MLILLKQRLEQKQRLAKIRVRSFHDTFRFNHVARKDLTLSFLSFFEQLTDLDGDGKRDTFTSCSTSEGVNFSVWNGEAYKSKLIWSDYYYLGYDSEADCPEIKW